MIIGQHDARRWDGTRKLLDQSTTADLCKAPPEAHMMAGNPDESRKCKMLSIKDVRKNIKQQFHVSTVTIGFWQLVTSVTLSLHFF